jgi:hypothetical protein
MESVSLVQCSIKVLDLLWQNSDQDNFLRLTVLSPIPVAMPSKESVYGCRLAGIAGSNPAGAMDVCLLWVLWIVR